MAIKIDIRKAFDTMDWDFILSILENFGFSNIFCSWILNIFQSARISILINGSPKGYFGCSRCVRQGDPLSPLLFCLAEDFLNRWLVNAFRDNFLVPMHVPGNTHCPSHWLYADDVLIFCRASRTNIHKIASVFESYGAISGQVVNWSKSIIYFGRYVSLHRSHMLGSIAGMQKGNLPLHYLGVPLFQGAPKKVGFNLWQIRFFLNLIIGKENYYLWQVGWP